MMNNKSLALEKSDFERIPVVAPVVMEELRRLSMPLMRLIAVNGMFNSEVRINSFGVYVFSPDAGSLFTSEEEAEIFQEDPGSV